MTVTKMAVLKRRHFLMGTGLITMAAGGGVAARQWFSDQALPSFYSCCQTDNGEYKMSLVRQGKELYSFALPGRGHALSASHDGRWLACSARRPGNWLKVVDAVNGRTVADIRANGADYYNGHVRYSLDDRYLFATQTEADTLNGYIGIYDAADNYRYLGKYLTLGQDPHELIPLPDGKTLAIANGGFIKSKKDGTPENLDEMASSLVYMDAASGKILAQYQPQHPWMSLRHMTLSKTGELLIGVQYQGSLFDPIPLVLGHNGEDQLQPYQADEMVYAAFSQYVASMATDSEGRFALSTSPKKGAIVLWDIARRSAIQQYQLRDVAGACWHEHAGAFVVSNSLGQLMFINPELPQAEKQFHYMANHHWDNHMIPTLYA